MPIAIVRIVSKSITHCQRTHVARKPIQYERAVAQHEDFAAMLGTLGCEVVHVAAAPDLPDAVFVEDTAVVLDEVAVIARPGAGSRRGETKGVEEVLSRYRKIVRMEAPATLDGGDVLRVGKRLFVGRSSRTNEAGVEQLRAHASGLGYEVEAVAVEGCLHLKSAVTLVGEGTLLGNGAWVDRAAFADLEWMDVDPTEPYGANALWLGNAVVYPYAHARTGALLGAHLKERGMKLSLVDVSELAKAEGGVTCCCLIVESAA